MSGAAAMGFTFLSRCWPLPALLSAQDGTFRDAGKVALWTKADSVTYFDTISIMTLK